MQTRSVSIFGATGSVGKNTVSIIKRNPAAFDVRIVSGAHNISDLARIAIELNASVAVTSEKNLLDELADLLENTGIAARAGRDELIASAMEPVDWAICAVVGFAGLELSLAIAKNGKTLALANKESLVCGGALLQDICKASGTTLLPVDSEHSAIFQALNGESPKHVERIILTASGGPFLNSRRDDLTEITPDQAADHPNWSMGKRISIDSASMFNKAMEVIETKELFGVSGDQIEVIIHPQSIIHSMVGFNDGSIMAHMGTTDMKFAIGYALYWPERADAGVGRLDFTTLSQLDFQPVDESFFLALGIARDTMKIGGIAGAVFNAAKEQSLDLFIEGKIGFLDMANLVAKTVKMIESSDNCEANSLDKISKADNWSRSNVLKLVNNEYK